MSWRHCDREIADSDRCPSCSITKEQWTVEFNVTKQLTVRRRLQLVLLDPDEVGVPAEPYRVELPDGRVLKGALDEDGRAALQVGSGDGRIVFPARRADEVQPFRPRDEEPEGGAAPAPVEEATGPAAYPGCSLAKRHRFQLRRVCVIDWTLHDEEGEAPLRFVEYEVVGPTGAARPATLRGRTDARGRLFHGRADRGLFTLRVAGVELRVPSVLPADAGLRVRVPAAAAEEEAAPAEDAGRVLSLTLYDEEGEGPLTFRDYTLTGEDGGALSGRTDARGRLHHGAVAGDLWTLRVGEQELRVPAVLPADAGLRVRVPGASRSCTPS